MLAFKTWRLARRRLMLAALVVIGCAAATPVLWGQNACDPFTFVFRESSTDNLVPYPMVRVVAKMDYDTDPTKDWTAGRRSYTAANGQVTIDNLPYGVYTVIVKTPQNGSRAFNLSVLPGQPCFDEVTLAPSDRSSSPPPGASRTRAPNAVDDCLAEVDKKYRLLREHLDAQDPSDGNVWVKYDTTPECQPALMECSNAVDERYANCPPGTDGTYSHCQITKAEGRIECCRLSLDCGERLARAGCGYGATIDPEVPKSKCTDDIQKTISQTRAHNAAQTLEGGVYMKSMNLVPRCAEAFNECWDKATKVYNECGPGPDGTYAHCTRIKQTTWLECAREEIDCTAREYGCR
jgi:hypothetical protein